MKQIRRRGENERTGRRIRRRIGIIGKEEREEKEDEEHKRRV